MADERTEVCSDVECDRIATKRGMCNKHYLRWWKATPKSDRLTPTTEERFWSKVNKSDKCWEWTGCTRPSGHGMFVAGPGRLVSAHAFSLELATGKATPPGMIACHRCDNPPCVNPRHIYYGTKQDNVDDAWARGRMPIGGERSAAKMNEELVLALRVEYADGGDAKALAVKYGIAVSTLRLTVLGYKWRHVGGPITRRRVS